VNILHEFSRRVANANLITAGGKICNIKQKTTFIPVYNILAHRAVNALSHDNTVKKHKIGLDFRTVNEDQQGFGSSKPMRLKAARNDSDEISQLKIKYK
jgi:hypothetical protein